VNTRTSSWADGYGSGRNSTQSITENTAAFNPMPMASVSTAVAGRDRLTAQHAERVPDDRVARCPSTQKSASEPILHLVA
jgi:hypothetical protein